ncbi:MAG: tetratricopeptide repeat protein [candidate division Zixibacteria bacterium]
MVRAFSVCLILSFEICLSASLKPSGEQIEVFSRAIDMVFADSFSQAYELIGEMPDTIPEKPLYHLLYGSVMHAEMLDSEDFTEEELFFDHIDSSIDFLKAWTDDNSDDPWGFLFLGSAYGYKSILHVHKKRWLKSLVNGLKARGKFSKAIKIDSTIYDAYTGLGNYHYWSSVKLGKYIPFLPDNREKGLTELRLAADSSLFSRKPALAGLAWALIEEREYREAIRIGEMFYGESGGGRNSLWILGGIYWRNGNLIRAAKYYNILLELFTRAGNQNNYNIIFCRYRLGVCAFKLGEINKATADFEAVLSREVTPEIEKRHKKTYKKARQYLEKIDKIVKERKKSL